MYEYIAARSPKLEKRKGKGGEGLGQGNRRHRETKDHFQIPDGIALICSFQDE